MKNEERQKRKRKKERHEAVTLTVVANRYKNRMT